MEGLLVLHAEKESPREAGSSSSLKLRSMEEEFLKSWKNLTLTYEEKQGHLP